MAITKSERVQIEFPSVGETYNKKRYGVYSYGIYPRSSVLAGQTRRTYLDDFETLEQAKEAYPKAVVSGSCYQPPYLNHLPDGPDL